MPKVHLLPEDVISKIAAGEVIERPASVIKELVENSLDAGSDSIEVHLKDGGKTLIRVKDNGHGIEKDDLERIFLRHATSKIRSADDLFDIHSLGFRGEALYSIGAIADVTVHSKTPEQNDGWELQLRGGQRLNLRPSSIAGHGTEIYIQELFFNTPARKKFLKSNTAEIHQILTTFLPYTLLHKDHRFLLKHQDRALIDITPCNDLTERAAQVLNLEKNHLIQASQGFPERGYTVKMVLGDINIKRFRRDMQFIFINNRPVFNKNIAYNMNQIYRLIMAPDEFPFFAVYIHMPAEDIDVNVHPTKREVKLKNENEICSILRALCEQHLMTKSKGKVVMNFGGRRGEQTQGQEATKNALQYAYTKEMSEIPTHLFESPQPGTDDTAYAYPRSSDNTFYQGIQPPQAQNFYVPGQNISDQDHRNWQAELSQARYIGSFINKYLLFEMTDSLFLIDQHAAQERIFYEQFIQQIDKGNVEVQPLLSPILIKLSPQELLAWEDSGEKFERSGFSCTRFDEETLAVHAHPRLIKDVEKAVRNLLDAGGITTFDHDTIARRACKASVVTGDRLSKEQAEYQRDRLVKCLDPFTCPHGRPIVIELTEKFLDKQFLRK